MEEREKQPKPETCKSCGTLICRNDMRIITKKFLGMRQMAFGGVENQYLRIATVTCPNKPACGKRYTSRSKVTEYYYG